MSEPQERRVEAYLQRVGHRARPLSDTYAYLLRASWATVVGLAAIVYLGLNAIFAFLYWVHPASVANSDGTYLGSFFFSVQTFASIGYGAMYAQGLWGNIVVVVEAFVSVFCIATLTGMAFAKFSRPYARVLFSRPILIETRDGVPTLTFRVANERDNNVAEASIRVSMLKTIFTKEGKRMRRFYDLTLERSSSPIFMMSWQIFHPITEASPLYGMTREQLIEDDARFIAMLSGLDETFSQMIHARHVYWADQIVLRHRFEDVIESLPNGVARMDFRKLHDIVPDE